MNKNEANELPLGRERMYANRRLRAIISRKSTCEGCAFESRDSCKNVHEVMGACWRGNRTDEKDVIFIEVKQ